MKKSISVPLGKLYQFPQWKLVEFSKKYLIIFPETAKWIVLDNKAQVNFFINLNNQSLKKALAISTNVPKEDYENVITQIEARNVLDTEVVSSNKGEKSMHFYLTNACNLRCPHCYMFAGIKHHDELTYKSIITILKAFKQNKGKRVNFSGGEIGLRSDLVDIVRYSKHLGLNNNLLTNGTLWTKELISDISPFVDSVQISIDGYSETTNALIRGKGNFMRALECAETFIRFKVDTTIAVTPLWNKNLKTEIKHYLDFAKELSAKYSDCDLFHIRFSAEMLDGRKVKLTDKERKEYNETMLSLFSSYHETDMSLYPFVMQRRSNIILDNCLYGELAVSSNGDAYCCSRIGDVSKIGNFKTDNIEIIFKALEKASFLSNINNLKPCCSCELKYICGGGCRIDYFKTLVKNNPLSLESYDIPPRKCGKENKRILYDLMLKTNRLIFQ